MGKLFTTHGDDRDALYGYGCNIIVEYGYVRHVGCLDEPEKPACVVFLLLCVLCFFCQFFADFAHWLICFECAKMAMSTIFAMIYFCVLLFICCVNCLYSSYMRLL